jgi:hypothetical protein
MSSKEGGWIKFFLERIEVTMSWLEIADEHCRHVFSFASKVSAQEIPYS